MVAIVREGAKGKQRKSQLIPKICPFCLCYFEGVKQKMYCSKYCMEQACRKRKEELIGAMATHFADYGLKRAHIEACAELWLKRLQKVAVDLGFAYDERAKQWVHKPTKHV